MVIVNLAKERHATAEFCRLRYSEYCTVRDTDLRIYSHQLEFDDVGLIIISNALEAVWSINRRVLFSSFIGDINFTHNFMEVVSTGKYFTIKF